MLVLHVFINEQFRLTQGATTFCVRPPGTLREYRCSLYKPLGVFFGSFRIELHELSALSLSQTQN